MNYEKYYIRVKEIECLNIENIFITHGIDYTILSKDMANGGTTLYSAYLISEELLMIKLSCQLMGCLNFGKTLGKLVPSTT